DATIDDADQAYAHASLDAVSPLPEPNTQTVEDAISITSRRLHQTESALPGAQQAVESAEAAVAAANRQHEKAKARLKALTHTLVETRSQMKMFHETTAEIEAQDSVERIHSPAAMPDDRFPSPQAAGREASARQQILSDLLEIEASLNARKRDSMQADVNGAVFPGTAGRISEKRQHHRVIYPLNQRPLLSIDNRTIPIFDLSTAGMRMGPDAALARSRIVRGVIAFAGRPAVNITGKVVRQDDRSLGLRLATRIGNHILDQERLRLSA
ncbi:MAG: hypothetical protein HGJ94_04615, partial [Desulfosarcina sp.]|nr:hypothetical protein [Desulfosarcina sp.]